MVYFRSINGYFRLFDFVQMINYLVYHCNCGGYSPTRIGELQCSNSATDKWLEIISDIRDEYSHIQKKNIYRSSIYILLTQI
jgi:hypothetical protein